MTPTKIETLLQSPDIQNTYVSFCGRYGKEVGDRYLATLAGKTFASKRTSPQKRPSGEYAQKTKRKIQEAIASLGECRRARINERLLGMGLRLSQSDLEWFLRVMREEGLIQARSTGRKFLYFVEKEAIAS